MPDFVPIPSVQLDQVLSDYGDATQGSVTSGATETFILKEGYELNVKVDGEATAQVVTFYEIDFDNILEATAQEVAAVLTAGLSGATATTSSGAVVITSDTYGSTSSIQVTGGTANDELQFSTSVFSGTDAGAYYLINRIPEPDEDGALASSNVQVDIFDAGGVAPDANNVDIYVDDNLAVDDGVFQTGYDGGGSATSLPDAATRRFVIDPTSNFSSDYTVSIRVIVTGGGGLDEKYYFSTQDLTQPGISSVVATGKKTIRVTYNEPVRQVSVTATDDALRPANYTIDRNPPINVPAVNVVVVEVTTVSSTVVDLTTDIELSFGLPYLLTVENVEDIEGNVMSPSLSTDVEFTAFSCSLAPAERSFSLWEMMAAINRTEDTTYDLYKWLGVIQEPTDLLLCEIDGLAETIDPDFAGEQFLDAMLFDLGNPFYFVELTELEKRSLIQVLIQIYKLKGTGEGIIDVVRLFLGLDVTIEAINTLPTWTLGDEFSQAILISALDEPFALNDGETLIIRVDHDSDETVTFNTAEFAVIGSATAEEVAAVITSEADGVSAAAMPDDTVLLQRDAGGEGTSIWVIGGTAADEFNFPSTPAEGTGTEVPYVSELGIDSYLTVSTGSALYTFNIVSDVDLTTDQIEKIRLIAEYMKPAHTHLGAIITPSLTIVYDHVELGYSELGGTATDPGTFILH